MLDLLVFTQHPSAYAPKRFKDEARSQGYTLLLCDYNEVDINSLSETKAIILREPDYKNNIYGLRDKILDHYIKSNSKILNKDSYLTWSILDKIKQHQEFKKAGIPHVSSLKLSDAKYPFIAKASLGSHGDRVYKIENKKDLDKVLENHNLEDLLIQEFQTSGFDLRVIVLGGRVLGIMKRSPKEGEFLSNFSQGGLISKYGGDGSTIVENIAIKTAKHFKLDYVGVDLMMGNDGSWKVLEVNRACQFKGFEQATGINIASEVVHFLTQ